MTKAHLKRIRALEKENCLLKELVAEKEFEGKEIERPKHWGGYLVKSTRIEFWQGRPNRMHDRIRFTLQEDDYSWLTERIQP